MLSRMVNFVAKPALVAVLADEARKSGVSISEVIREAVREKMAVE